MSAVVAQLGERRTEDPKAACSSHADGTIFLLNNFLFHKSFFYGFSLNVFRYYCHSNDLKKLL